MLVFTQRMKKYAERAILKFTNSSGGILNFWKLVISDAGYLFAENGRLMVYPAGMLHLENHFTCLRCIDAAPF